MTATEQKLAAILAADVAGYSALMADDAPATVAQLDACRAVFADQVGAKGGRIVDTAGDSVLATFASAIGAVEAARAVQDALQAKNDAQPEARRMRFRIGVNLGDVIEKLDGSIYGDGVNIAARLESLAAPGGITVSGSVFDSVDGKIDAAFEDVGEHDVKNIARPVRVYRLRNVVDVSEKAPPPKPDKPSIAVLPFNNLSGDPEQEYFADGISEDIITDLSKALGLLVIARNSSFAYKGQSPDIVKVARELGVAFVLEGSVRKAGGRVRINAQLIDAGTSAHIWAERYDRDLDDVFQVQDDVTQAIVAALKVQLSPIERAVLAHRGTDNIEAYDAYLRGRDLMDALTEAGNIDARPWLEKAIALDSDFAEPLAALASVWMTAYANDWGEDWQDGLRRGHEIASRAVAVNELSPSAHAVLGIAYLWQLDHERAIAEERRAVELDPNYASGYMLLAQALHYAGDSATALAHNETCIRLDPRGLNQVLHDIALCHFMLSDYEAAERVLRERILRHPKTDISRGLLASIYGHQGRVDEARRVLAELRRINPDYAFAKRRIYSLYKNPADPERITEGLRKAGLDMTDDD